MKATTEELILTELITLKSMAVRTDSRFDAIDERFDGIDARFDRMDIRFDAMDRRFDAMDERFDNIDDEIKQFHFAFGMANDYFKDHEKRIEVLEELEEAR